MLTKGTKSLNIIIMKTILLTSALLISFVGFGQNKKDINDMPMTKKIVSIQYGVTCGKTGKSSVYVYFKDKNKKGFNPNTDRELVYMDSLYLLRKTAQYINYASQL